MLDFVVLLSPMETKIIKTSFSALDTFRQCPLKYKYQVIDKIKAPKIKEAVFGNKIHKALQFFHSKTPVSPTLDELLNYLKEVWESEVFGDEQTDMIYFSEAIKILKNYYEHYLKTRDKFIVLNTETRFEVLLENPKDQNQKTLLRGFIDRVDKTKEGIEVIDYKTAKKLPSQQEVDNNLQLSLYCLGVLGRWPQFLRRGLENIKLTFYYLKHQELLSTRRTKEQLDNVKEQIWQKLAEIEKSDFPPIPSSLCDWCGYRRICPMWKHLYKEQISIDDEKVKKVVDEFFELKQINSKNNKKLNELKEMIEGYLDKEKLERVFGETGYITRLTQTRYDYDSNKLKQIIKTLPHSVKKYKILKATPKKVHPHTKS
jgi:RecB family exonuclease